MDDVNDCTAVCACEDDVEAEPMTFSTPKVNLVFPLFVMRIVCWARGSEDLPKSGEG